MGRYFIGTPRPDVPLAPHPEEDEVREISDGPALDFSDLPTARWVDPISIIGSSQTESCGGSTTCPSDPTSPRSESTPRFELWPRRHRAASKEDSDSEDE